MVSSEKIEGRIISGIFQERLNRFLASVKVDDTILPSFLPNPGRMHELLAPGTEVILRDMLKENRNLLRSHRSLLWQSGSVGGLSRV